MTHHPDSDLPVTRKRVEVARAPHPRAATTAVGGSLPGVAVLDEKDGALTWQDRVKAYYHTIFAALSAVAIIVVEVAPDLNALPGISETWRHWVTLAVVVANVIVTRAKSNQVWVQS